MRHVPILERAGTCDFLQQRLCSAIIPIVWKLHWAHLLQTLQWL